MDRVIYRAMSHSQQTSLWTGLCLTVSKLTPVCGHASSLKLFSEQQIACIIRSHNQTGLQSQYTGAWILCDTCGASAGFYKASRSQSPVAASASAPAPVSVCWGISGAQWHLTPSCDSKSWDLYQLNCSASCTELISTSNLAWTEQQARHFWCNRPDLCGATGQTFVVREGYYQQSARCCIQWLWGRRNPHLHLHLFL